MSELAQLRQAASIARQETQVPSPEAASQLKASVSSGNRPGQACTLSEPAPRKLIGLALRLGAPRHGHGTRVQSVILETPHWSLGGTGHLLRVSLDGRQGGRIARLTPETDHAETNRRWEVHLPCKTALLDCFALARAAHDGLAACPQSLLPNVG
jgi:hypothetical protein